MLIEAYCLGCEEKQRVSERVWYTIVLSSECGMAWLKSSVFLVDTATKLCNMM